MENYLFENEIKDAFQRDTPRTPTRSCGIITPTKTPKTPGRTNKTPSNDRFIPNRGNINLELAQFKISKGETPPTSPSRVEFKGNLTSSMFDDTKLPSKILSFKEKAPLPVTESNRLRVLYSSTVAPQSPKPSRYISQKPERVLDAPGIVDDYYLNLVDWGTQNLVAVALSSSIYIWNAVNSKTSLLFSSPDPLNAITSVSWAKDGRHLSVGFDDGSCQIWDVESERALRNIRGHASRISSMSWNEINSILTTGSRDTMINNYDVRIQNPKVSQWGGHVEEICGIKWNDKGTMLASGSNDNTVRVWNLASQPSGLHNSDYSPSLVLTDHIAAVKALAWCPWQSDLLASGGGTADRTIKFWNVNTGALLNSVDTHSQVSSLVWSKNSAIKEIVSSHGFSHNEISIWKYPSLTRISKLRGHDSRILNMSQSPDGERVVTASADETLRFWKIFDYVSSSNVHPGKGSARKSYSRHLNLR